jgi:hypothetical protein
MSLQDHPAKTRVILVLDIHHARQSIGPDDLAARFFAQNAVTDRFD